MRRIAALKSYRRVNKIQNINQDLLRKEAEPDTDQLPDLEEAGFYDLADGINDPVEISDEAKSKLEANRRFKELGGEGDANLAGLLSLIIRDINLIKRKVGLM